MPGIVRYYTLRYTLPMTGKERIDILRYLTAQQDNICTYCNLPFTDSNPPTLDHKIPRIAGGADNLDNLQALHRLCNTRKGKKINGISVYSPSLKTQTARTIARTLAELGHTIDFIAEHLNTSTRQAYRYLDGTKITKLTRPKLPTRPQPKISAAAIYRVLIEQGSLSSL